MLKQSAMRIEAVAEAPKVEACEADILQQIRGAGVGLAIWNRKAPAGLRAELGKLDLSQVQNLRLVASAQGLPAKLSAGMRQAGYPNMPAFRAHILESATRLLDVAGAPGVVLRLECIADNACRLFHADYVTLRGLTTYIGPGTQWIPAAAGPDPGPADIRTVEPFAFALLKGRLWADEPSILHRSPPIAETGQQRLLLVIDAVDDPISNRVPHKPQIRTIQ